MTSPSATQNSYPYQNEPIWSKTEKVVARRAFDAALKRKLHDVIRETKQMAKQINEPADLWDLEHYLIQRRREIDRKYDYRYAQLTHVFGQTVARKPTQ
jgi:Photoprotection regulator fluorescence recovery protein